LVEMGYYNPLLPPPSLASNHDPPDLSAEYLGLQMGAIVPS
jgi:hypothetical protein